jgi:hypothetical protein
MVCNPDAKNVEQLKIDAELIAESITKQMVSSETVEWGIETFRVKLRNKSRPDRGWNQMTISSKGIIREIRNGELNAPTFKNTDWGELNNVYDWLLETITSELANQSVQLTGTASDIKKYKQKEYEVEIK